MKVIIAGSRSVTDYDSMLYAINGCKYVITEVVSGAARGVDKLGERYAKENNIPVTSFPADWDTYGRSAGYKRNLKMAEYADALIAIWDGKSKGTKHVIDTMIKLGKMYVVYFPES